MATPDPKAAAAPAPADPTAATNMVAANTATDTAATDGVGAPTNVQLHYQKLAQAFEIEGQGQELLAQAADLRAEAYKLNGNDSAATAQTANAKQMRKLVRLGKTQADAMLIHAEG
jgi:polysaccharide pyruvyl transferase WcaK-like protein